MGSVDTYFNSVFGVGAGEDTRRDFEWLYARLEKESLAENFDLLLVPLLADVYVTGIRNAQNFVVKNTMLVR